MNQKVNNLFLILIFVIIINLTLCSNSSSQLNNEIIDIKKTIVSYQEEIYKWYNINYFDVPFEKKVSVYLIPFKSNNNYEDYYYLYLCFKENKKFKANRFVILKDFYDKNSFIYVLSVGKKGLLKESIQYDSRVEFEKSLKNISNNILKEYILFKKERFSNETIHVGQNKSIIDGIKNLIKKDININGLHNYYNSSIKVDVAYFNINKYSCFNAFKNSISIFYKYKDKDVVRNVLIYERDDFENNEILKNKNNFILTDKYILIFLDVAYPYNKSMLKEKFITELRKNQYYYQNFIRFKTSISIPLEGKD